MSPNFILLDAALPDVARLVTAMVQARDAVDCRSWSRPQEPITDAWWADVLADPRAQKRERRSDLAVKQAFYRLADEKREALVGRIGEELRKKKPKHFVDERSLADFHASLEHAASVLEQTIHTPTSTAKGLQERSRQRHLRPTR